MPTSGLISKENLKQILVFFPAVVYNIFVVLFSFQLNYTTQKRICPACGLQILFCLLGAFFHSPIFCAGKQNHLESTIECQVNIAFRFSISSFRQLRYINICGSIEVTTQSVRRIRNTSHSSTRKGVPSRRNFHAGTTGLHSEADGGEGAV